MQPILTAVDSRSLHRRGVRILALSTLVLIAQPLNVIAQPETVLLSVELPAGPSAGARLFAQKSCSRCHSLGSGDDSRVGPDLGRILFTGTVLDLAGAFWNHSPVMREKMQDFKIPVPTVTVDEMANLIAFLSVYRHYLTEVGQPGDPSAGRRVFVEKQCETCHAQNDAANWDKLGPGLQRYRGRSSSIFLAQAMWNHGAEMEAVMRGQGVRWPMFEGREMGDLVAYLQAGNAGSGVDPVYFTPGDPRRGRDAFQNKRCDTCHAIMGRGGEGGPDLGLRGGELITSVAEVAGLMWNHSQGMTAEFERRNIPRVTFSGQEMANIIAYLYFVNYASVRGAPSRGAAVFVSNCSMCHSIGAGQRVGPDLATAADLDEPLSIITSMWNHASAMQDEMRRRGLPWPQFRQGDAADLVAFLISRRTPAAPDVR